MFAQFVARPVRITSPRGLAMAGEKTKTMEEVTCLCPWLGDFILVFLVKRSATGFAVPFLEYPEL